ncbi:MAG: NAD(P)H-dependent oxidoreductase [Thaumarchaeota archaeon]|nr:NAD(P)H-dependent oxidoreductase [Nitrososphaerota archaeon]MBI3642112.1 NAD(P)H-dependent oxidoreductase [Nitrososphaerota archaeon]
MKTLLVKYTPRNERSSSKKLLDTFREKIQNSEIEELDLSNDVPDMFLAENLAAYIQRNYLGQNLTPEQKKLMSKMDRMTEQLKSSDIVVVGFPMNNFSMPAAVKAWFDSVMLKGQTWDVNDGGFVGMMNGKKALVIVTSGGFYSKGPMVAWEHALSLTKIEFQFMGYSDVQGILAEGMNAGDDTQSSNLKKSIEQIQSIAQKWYN